MQLVADLGGVPGKDCRGFCKYCYFKKAKPLTEPLGCRHCPPGKIGCPVCNEGVQEMGHEFYPAFQVLNELQMSLMMNQILEILKSISPVVEMSAAIHSLRN